MENTTDDMQFLNYVLLFWSGMTILRTGYTSQRSDGARYDRLWGENLLMSNTPISKAMKVVVKFLPWSQLIWVDFFQTVLNMKYNVKYALYSDIFVRSPFATFIVATDYCIIINSPAPYSSLNCWYLKEDSKTNLSLIIILSVSTATFAVPKTEDVSL